MTWVGTTERFRIQYPKLALLRPGLLLAVLVALPAVAWISPRVMSAELWDPIDTRRIGVTWLGLSTAAAAAWLTATGRARSGVGRRVLIGFTGGPTVTAVVLLWLMVVPSQLAIRSAAAVNDGLRTWSAIQADARALDLRARDDGSFHRRSILDSFDLHQAVCYGLTSEADASRFLEAALRYVPFNEVPELRVAIDRVVGYCRYGGELRAVIRDSDSIDRARNSLCEVSYATVTRAERSFWFLALALGGALMLGLGFASMTQLNLAAAIRTLTVGLSVLPLARLAQWEPWDTSDGSGRWIYTICLVAAIGLVAACASGLRRTRIGVQIAVACLLVPVLCTAALLTLEPVPGELIQEPIDPVITWFGIQFATPGHPFEDVVAWLFASYLVLSPLIGWCLTRYAMTPRET